jgi:hypothetical protein
MNVRGSGHAGKQNMIERMIIDNKLDIQGAAEKADDFEVARIRSKME